MTTPTNPVPEPDPRKSAEVVYTTFVDSSGEAHLMIQEDHWKRRLYYNEIARAAKKLNEHGRLLAALKEMHALVDHHLYLEATTGLQSSITEIAALITEAEEAP